MARTHLQSLRQVTSGRLPGYGGNHFSVPLERDSDKLSRTRLSKLRQKIWYPRERQMSNFFVSVEDFAKIQNSEKFGGEKNLHLEKKKLLLRLRLKRSSTMFSSRK